MRLAAAGVAAVLLAAAGARGAGDHHAGGHHEAATSEPPLLYELPPVGSYELPVIDRVGEYRLLGADGEPADLPGLAPDECALVAFVYLSCTDASGCPLSLATLQRVDRELARRDDLGGRVKLVTVSFDPERDDPPAMANLRRHMAPRGAWRFLTASDASRLAPVLEDYGQDVVPLLTANGERAGLMRHVAKVFLVDGRGRVRNVYSTGFLEPGLLLRDVETLFATPAPEPG